MQCDINSFVWWMYTCSNTNEICKIKKHVANM
jgi:hypothetical protein